MLRAIGCTLLVISLVSSSPAWAQQKIDALSYAKGAADWILSVGVDRDGVLTWPVNDTDRKLPAYDLCYGMPGGILLIAELAKEDTAGPYAKALQAGLAGLESMKVPIPVPRSDKSGVLPAGPPRETWGTLEGGNLQTHPGLYSGLSGIAWLYLELYRLTGETKYLDRARSVVETLLDQGLFRFDALLWDNSTDIVSGAAGTGLLFLRAASVLKNPRCAMMAERAGDFLIRESIETPAGLKWKINAGIDTVYPNFAYGTSGVGYFLLRLFEATKRTKYLSAALAAAQELEFEADENSRKKTCAWFHHEGDGEDLYYAGWCHGPGGTARLFYELARMNTNPEFKAYDKWIKQRAAMMPPQFKTLLEQGERNEPMDWVDCAANWLLVAGVPEPAKPIKGFWNEGICNGTAGVGEFFVDLYLATKKPDCLAAAGKMAVHLAKVAEPAGGGFRWTQAEDRVAPLKRDAQTGYGNGAAGVGLFFLKLARAEKGIRAGWQLPDNPF